MNDRELLELAVKAVGVHGQWDTYKGQFRRYVEGQSTFLGDAWLPLEDDGDALRLAVSCGFELLFAQGIICDEDGICIRQFTCGDMGDLRRAITSAAAEIGRAMP